MVQIRTNPNDRATIAILCPYIFFANAFKDLLPHLPNAEIVPDFTATPAGKPDDPEIRRLFREWLTDSGLPWREIDQTRDAPSQFFAKYHTVVTPYYGGWVRHPALKAHKKVRVFYGAAKDLWGFALWNAHYDLICTPGPYFTDTLNDLYGRFGTKVVSTGEPKLDDLATLTKESARGVLGIETNLPVILVASTWGRASALDRIAPSLISLSDRYAFVVKAHHRTSNFDSDAMGVFDSTNVRVIDQRTPVPVAIAAADAMISDGSGAIFDAVRADKPLVVVDIFGTPDDDFFIETGFYGQRQEKLAGTTTYAASTDQRIKREGQRVGPVVDAATQLIMPERIADALEEAITDRESYASARETLIQSHFVPIDGRAAERVATEIRNLSAAHSTQPSKYSNLFRAILRESYERAQHEGINLQEKKNDDEARAARTLHHLKRLPYMERVRAVIHEFFE
jgi:CDP-glycerol glycerophosphotransferase (TagB/SpsB family)